MTRDGLRVKNGLLSYGGPTLDSLRRQHQRDADEEEVGDDVVARYPATYSAAVEGNELVIRSGRADTLAMFEGDDVETLPDNREEHAEHERKTDRHSLDRHAHDRAPRTLAALNAFHQRHYARRQRPRGG